MELPVIVGIAVLAVAVLVAIALLVRTARPSGRRPSRVPGSQAPVVLTQHARERMQQRGVDLPRLQQVLRSPHRQTFDATKHSVCLERDFGDDTLRVWVVPPWPSPLETVVKTTAWRITRTCRVPQRSVGRLIGPGGATVRAIQARTGTRISVGRGGAATVRGGSEREVLAAIAEIRSIA